MDTDDEGNDREPEDIDEEEGQEEADQPNREEFQANSIDMSDAGVEEVYMPRETEHLVSTVYFVGGKNLCGHCIFPYCSDNGFDRFESRFKHDVVTTSEVRAIYAETICGVCSVGLMRVLGRRNCPTCHCEDCAKSDFPEHCRKCQTSRIKESYRVTEWSVTAWENPA